MRQKEMIRRANALLTVMIDLGRNNDPRVDGYIKEIGQEYGFSKAYGDALEIAEREGHTDIAERLKKHTQNI